MDKRKMDLVEALALNSERLQFLGIKGTRSDYLNLRVYVRLHSIPFGALDFFEIICTNAVDYVIRPRNPNCIEGGPMVELHKHHPLLDRPGLQDVPGGDGEMFNPPLKLQLLILEQSHVIAERFEIQPWEWNGSSFS